MTSNTLQQVYEWAKHHLDRAIMLNYQLYKVNGQTPGKVFLLLREAHALRATVEIQIEYLSDPGSSYLVVFRPLPATGRQEHPAELSPVFATQQEVIHWLKTGHSPPSS
jgi:hypothetical protein